VADDLIIDLWSGLDHKVGMGKLSGGVQAAPPWVKDPLHVRRLNAYMRIHAYLENVAREFLAPDARDPERAARWREYGDGRVMVERIAAAMIGTKATVGIVGADAPVPDAPDIRPAPRPPADGLEDFEQQVRQAVFDAASMAWQAEAEATLEAWLHDLEALPKLKAREEWLQRWAADEHIMAKVREIEREGVVPLGSGVLVLGWDPARNRVGVEIFEPDVYFPVLAEGAPGEFPAKVHLAWQFDETDDAGTVLKKVRRITYELVPVVPAEGEEDPAPGVDRGEQPRYIGPDDTWTHSCLVSDGTWLVDDFERVDGIQDGAVWAQAVLRAGEAPVELQQLAIGLDFIPVIHVPNTQASMTHFGRSIIPALAQLLDELAATDADEAMASRWAGQPPLVVKGLEPGRDSLDLSPGGGAVRTGAGGGIETVPMAENLEKLGARILALLKRLSVNGSVPEGLIGRVDAAEVPSGLALTLSFTAFEQMVEGGREAREMPYSLALKMVQRIALQNEDETLSDDQVYPAELRFGSFMPQDLAGIAGIIKILVEARAMSQETAVRMAQDHGVPVEDVAAEVLAIRQIMTDAALQIADALGAERYAADFLGVANFDAGDAAGVDAEAGGTAAGPGATVDPGIPAAGAPAV
jgi:hypothetical protein